MYENCPARLRMTHVILDGGFYDETAHPCKIIRYQEEGGCIYLLTGKAELPFFSLDALYECTIHAPEGTVSCEGVLTERYWDRRGKIVVFRIVKGFYNREDM